MTDFITALNDMQKKRWEEAEIRQAEWDALTPEQKVASTYEFSDNISKAEAYTQLLIRYMPAAKTLCNCSRAYYTHCGRAWVGEKEITDHPTCKHGCATNQLDAADHIALMALKEIGHSPK